MVYCPDFWNKFKNSDVLHIFIQLQMRPDISAMTKQKILKIIQILSLRDSKQLPAPPANLRPRREDTEFRDFID